MQVGHGQAVSNPEHAQGRAITSNDLFQIQLVSDPRPSPDGRQVAYVVTRLDKESDSYKAAIWLAPVDSNQGAPRQLTSGLHRDTTPRWSPDGSELAFASNRPGEKTSQPDNTGQPAADGDKELPTPTAQAKGPAAKGEDDTPKSQIWLIRVAGGEARQLTRQDHGASAPAWSPDGRTIAFLSATDPTDEEKGPSPVADERIHTRISYRFDGRGYIDRHDHVWTIPVAGGEAKQLTFGPYDDGGLAWSPDGSRIAFLSARTPDREYVERSLIYTVPAAGSETRCLTGDQTDYVFETIAWSPDGSRIATIGVNDPLGAYAKNAHLWTLPSGGGDPINHTRHWDRGFGDHGMSDVYVGSDVRPVWTADNQAVLMLASEHGATHVYRVEVDQGEHATVNAVTSGPRRIVSFAPVSDDASRLVVTVGEPHRPFELAIIESNSERALTDHNRAFLDEVYLSQAEKIWFRSAADDRDIQGWMLTPAGFKAGAGVKYPAIIEIHGGPHAMYGWAMFHEMQLMAARGYVVMFTNPRGSSGYGEEFTTCTRAQWGESDMPDIMGALDALLARGDVDPARVGVTGGSYGGYLTNWLIGHTDRFKAAVTQRCVSNFYSFYGTSDIGWTFGDFEFGGNPWENAELLLKHSPISYVHEMRTPLLIIHNEQDLRCPIEQAEQLFTFLKKLGREVEFVRIPDENHDLSRSGTPSRRLARLHHLVGWFDRHL